MFGTTTPSSLFGSSQAATGGLFGQQQQPQGTTGLFGSTAPSSVGLFGSTTGGGGGLFGSMQQTTGTTGGGLFGAASQSRPSGTGLFGSAAAQPLQQAPGLFGSTTQGSTTNTGLFGSTTSNTTSGLFAQPTQPQQGGGLFGSTQPSTTGGSLFGTTSTGGGLFGTTSTTTPSTSFGTSVVQQPTGTRDIKYRDDLNKDPQGARIQAICNMPEVNQQKSLEELRWEDYQIELTPGKTVSSLGSNTSGLFGTSNTTSGLFGSSQPQQTGGLFGSTQTGNTSGGLFGSSGTGGGLFGQKSSVGGLFGSTTQQPGGGLFGTSSTGGATSGTGGLFGATPQTSTSGGTTFGTTQPGTGGGGLFGSTPTTATSGGLFGQPNTSTSGGLFGTSTTPTSSGLFGSTATPPATTGALFGQSPTATSNLFGSAQPTTSNTGIFGTAQPAAATGGGGFGATSGPNTGGLFGSSPTGLGTTGGGLFGSTQPTATTAPGTTTSLFGSTSGGFFGQKPATTSGGLFQPTPTTAGSGLFGTTSQSTTAGTGLFGQKPATTGGLFGGAGSSGTTGTSLFGQPTDAVGGSTGLFGQPASSRTGTAGGLFGSNGSGCGLFGSTLGHPSSSLTVTGVQQQANGIQGALPLQLAPSVADPYGMQRLGLMTGLYGAPIYTALGGWPGAIPNPFAFPTPGVILPTQFRRFKSATLSQIWRPLPEYTADHRRLQLPSVTPRRQTRASQMRTPGPVTSALKSDYGWNEYDLSTLLYPPRQTRETPTRTTSPMRQTSTSRVGQWTPFRRTASESEDEAEDPRYGIPTYRSHRATENPYQQIRRLRQKWRDGQDTADKTLGHLQDVDVKTPLRPQYEEAEIPYTEERDDFRHEAAGSSWVRNGMTKLMGAAGGARFVRDEGHSSRGVLCNREFIDTDRTPRDKKSSTRSQSVPLRDDWTSSIRQTGRLKLRSEKDSGIDQDLVPRCTGEGYSTKPSIETLQSYSESRLAAVEDFTVVREGFGEVTWPGLTDVRGLNVDDVVRIEDKAIEVYRENDREKTGVEVPEIGVGLNKPALVTLLNCRPKNLSVTDENSPEFKQAYEDHVRKLRKYTEKMKAHFISLSPQWAWKFRVDHFSRYGYEEEDSEDVVTMPHAVVTPLTSQERQRPMGLRPDDQSLPPTCRISEAESLDSSSAVKRPYSLMRTAGTNLADRESYQKTKPCFGRRPVIHTSSSQPVVISTTSSEPFRQQRSTCEVTTVHCHTKLATLCARLGLTDSSSSKSDPELLQVLLGDSSSIDESINLFAGNCVIRPSLSPDGQMIRSSLEIDKIHKIKSYGVKRCRILMTDRLFSRAEGPIGQSLPNACPMISRRSSVTELLQQREEDSRFLDDLMLSTFAILRDRFGVFPLEQDEINELISCQLRLYWSRMQRCCAADCSSQLKSQMQTSIETWWLVAALFGTVVLPSMEGDGEGGVNPDEEAVTSIGESTDVLGSKREDKRESIIFTSKSRHWYTEPTDFHEASNMGTPMIIAQKTATRLSDSVVDSERHLSRIDSGRRYHPRHPSREAQEIADRQTCDPSVIPGDSHHITQLRSCIERRQRLELLNQWLSSVNKTKIMPILENDEKQGEDVEQNLCVLGDEAKRLRRAFLLVTANDIPGAVNELLSHTVTSSSYTPHHEFPNRSRFIRLALALSGSGSSCIGGAAINHEPHLEQLLEWQKRGVYDKLPPMILRLHHVLAGCIDSLVVEETLDWKGVLGLLLWYPAPDANLYESPMSTEEPSKKGNGLIESMKMARQKDKKKTKTQPPALPYDVVSPQIPYLSPNNQIENSNTSSPSFSDSTVASGLLYPFDKASRFSTRFHRSSLISETPFFQALHAFQSRLLNVPGQATVPAPLPDWHPVERRPLRSTDNVSMQYNLLRLFTRQLASHEYKQLFDPSSYSLEGTDIPLSWMLLRVLSRVLCHCPFDENMEVSSEANSFSLSPVPSWEILINEVSDYLDRMFTQQLEEVGHWHHSILVKLGGFKGQTLKQDRIQLCREILSIIGRNIPHPEVPATSTHLLKFRKSVTFLIESVGIPAIFIRHCQAQKLSSVGMSREACEIWLECAETAHRTLLQNSNPFETSSNASLFFKSVDLSPSVFFGSCLPSPTSYFCYAASSLLSSMEVRNGIISFCSLAVGDSFFLRHALQPPGSHQDRAPLLTEPQTAIESLHNRSLMDTVIQNKPSCQKLLVYAESEGTDPLNKMHNNRNAMGTISVQSLTELFNDDVSGRRSGIDWHGDRMIRKTVYSLCCQIVELGERVMNPHEWKQSPIMIICTAVVWIHRIVFLHERLERNGDSEPGMLLRNQKSQHQNTSPLDVDIPYKTDGSLQRGSVHPDDRSHFNDDLTHHHSAVLPSIEESLDQLRHMADLLFVVVGKQLENNRLQQRIEVEQQSNIQGSKLPLLVCPLPVFGDSLEFQSPLPPFLKQLDTMHLPTLVSIDRLVTSCLQGLYISSNHLTQSDNHRALADHHSLELLLSSQSPTLVSYQNPS